MKALSVQQPWATLLSIGAKTIETRTWATTSPGTIVIHASRAYPPELRLMERNPAFYSALHHDGLYADPSRDAGQILAVADVVACVKVDYLLDGRSKYASRLTNREKAFGDYREGRWGWILENVRRLVTPIACRGSRVLWPLPPDVELRMLGELCA
ncbi:MAG TPA: ASCH domain-containing protein [Thermoanaerobaculia bacterium]|nr:ASCH domain-containing protein [Thermoanaerobaculia bacterium]